jgi:hypothetical protein
MTKDEKILIAFAALMIMAIIIWRKPIARVVSGETSVADEIGMSQTQYNASVTRGPEYMMYNAPYAFAPPLGNFLPSITAGQVGQTVNKPTNFESEYWLN